MKTKLIHRRGFNLHILPGMERECNLLMHEIFDTGPYVRHGFTIKDNDCIVDLGANMGLFSLWCTTQAQNLRLYGVEPIPPLVHLARLNMEDARCASSVLEPYGVGSANNNVEFTFFPRATACSTMYGPSTMERMPALYAGTSISLSDLWSIHKGVFLFGLLCGPLYPMIRPIVIERIFRHVLQIHHNYTCAIVTLSDLIERWQLEQIDLLKIDVQGAETDVLKGINDSHWEQIQSMVIEVNAFLGNGEHVHLPDLLQKRGFHVVRDDDPEIASPGSYFLYATRSQFI